MTWAYRCTVGKVNLIWRVRVFMPDQDEGASGGTLMIRTVIGAAIVASGIATVPVTTHLMSSSNPVYYACVKGTSFDNDPGAKACAAGWTKIQWNQTGPAGPRGKQGRAGPQGPPGPVPDTDTGIVQVIQQLRGTYESFENTCTSLRVSGPDASSISVSSYEAGCVISGLPKGFTWTLTPVNDVCEYTGSNPTGGGPGTPCPNYTSDNSDLPVFLLSGDYANSADTALLVVPDSQQKVTGEHPLSYAADDFIWQATACGQAAVQQLSGRALNAAESG
jgi:hypothetical protein